jgi:xanthine dehydrogenase accessory factor
MRAPLLSRLVRARDEGRAVALVTDLADGAQALFGDGCDDGDDGNLRLSEDTMAAVRNAVTLDRSALLDGEGRRLFVQVFAPLWRLIVVGAVHLAEPLATMAGIAGFAVTLVDPRDGFAGRGRFGAVPIVVAWPDEALARLAPDARSAVVVLTHDPKLDDPALEAALRSDAFYIGALGSRRSHGLRLERLRARGLTEADLARIHGPVGLPIGARSPAEIAISILAEITQVRRRRSP